MRNESKDIDIFWQSYSKKWAIKLDTCSDNVCLRIVEACYNNIGMYYKNIVRMYTLFYLRMFLSIILMPFRRVFPTA